MQNEMDDGDESHRDKTKMLMRSTHSNVPLHRHCQRLHDDKSDDNDDKSNDKDDNDDHDDDNYDGDQGLECHFSCHH